MITRSISTTHQGLERVLGGLRAAGELAVAAVHSIRERAYQSREVNRMLEIARTDPRLMADLRAASMRAEQVSGRNH